MNIKKCRIFPVLSALLIVALSITMRVFCMEESPNELPEEFHYFNQLKEDKHRYEILKYYAQPHTYADKAVELKVHIKNLVILKAVCRDFNAYLTPQTIGEWVSITRYNYKVIAALLQEIVGDPRSLIYKENLNLTPQQIAAEPIITALNAISLARVLLSDCIPHETLCKIVNFKQGSILNTALNCNDIKSEIFQLLLKDSANPNREIVPIFVKTEYLKCAINLDKVPIEKIKLLLQYGAQPNTTQCNNSHPLLLTKNQEIINLLTEYGTDWDLLAVNQDITPKQYHGLLCYYTAIMHCKLKAITRNFLEFIAGRKA